MPTDWDICVPDGDPGLQKTKERVNHAMTDLPERKSSPSVERPELWQQPSNQTVPLEACQTFLAGIMIVVQHLWAAQTFWKLNGARKRRAVT